MMRYLKLGGIALAILMGGFLLGSGSIGDIVRTWLAGTGSSADQAEVEENRQSLANRDVDTMGQSLGTERGRLGFNSAIRCIALSEELGREDTYDEGAAVSIPSDELLTVEANARAVAYDRIGDQKVEQAGIEIAREVNFATSHAQRFHGTGVGSERTTSWTELALLAGQERVVREHEQDVRRMEIEFQNTCTPLLGRRAMQQSAE